MPIGKFYQLGRDDFEEYFVLFDFIHKRAMWAS